MQFPAQYQLLSPFLILTLQLSSMNCMPANDISQHLSVSPSSLPSTLKANELLELHVFSSVNYRGSDIFEVTIKMQRWLRCQPFTNTSKAMDAGVGRQIYCYFGGVSPRSFTVVLNVTRDLHNEQFKLTYDFGMTDYPLIQGAMNLVAEPDKPILNYVATQGEPLREGTVLQALCNSTFRGIPPREMQLELAGASPIPPVDPPVEDAQKNTFMSQKFNLTWRSDGQVLRCKLGDTVESNMSLTVHYAARDISFDVEDSDLVYLQPGGKVMCSALGQPRPTILWTQDTPSDAYAEEATLSKPYFEQVVEFTKDGLLLIRSVNISQLVDEMVRNSGHEKVKRQFTFAAKCAASNRLDSTGVAKILQFRIKAEEDVSQASVYIIVIGVVGVCLVLIAVVLVCYLVRRKASPTKGGRSDHLYASVDRKAAPPPSVPPPPPQVPSSKVSPPVSDCNYAVIMKTDCPPGAPQPHPVPVAPRPEYSQIIGVMEPVSASAPLHQQRQQQQAGLSNNNHRPVSPPVPPPPPSQPKKAVSPPPPPIPPVAHLPANGSPYYYPDGEPIPTEV